MYAFNIPKKLYGCICILLQHNYYHYWSINLSFPFSALAELFSQPPGFTKVVSFNDSKAEEEVKREKEDNEEKEEKGSR